jgi:predicted MFS family arabinose efflux permease
MKFKITGITFPVLLGVISLSIAGSAIYELPYIKYVYYDSMLEAFRMDDRQSGFLLSMYAMGCMICYVPGGIIADRFSTKKLLLISLFSTGALGVALALTMNYAAAAVIHFLFALSTSFLFWTALMKALRILGGKSDSGSVYGLYYALGSLVALACSFGYYAAFEAFIGESAEKAMRGVILAMSGAVILSGILVFFTYKDSREPTTAEEDKFRLKDLPVALKNPYVWGASVLMFLMYAVYSCSSYFTPFLTHRVGMDVSEAGFVAIIRTYVMFFLSPIGGWIADKILKSTLKLYAIGFVILAVFFFCVMLVPSGMAGKGAAIAVTMITSAFTIMLYGIMWSILNELKIPVVYAATVVGICSVVAYMPDLFMQTIFGDWLVRFGDESGYLRIFVCLGIFCIAAMALSVFMAWRVKKNQIKTEDGAAAVPATAGEQTARKGV